MVEDEAIDEVGESEMLVEFASCQAGIAGLPRTGMGVDGAIEVVDPRLRRSAFRDFNS